MMESTFLKLKENEREKRKAVLIDAAMRLFEKKSFQDIGMRDIAKEAGVSAASIYRYFESKDDLYSEALNIELKFILKLFEKTDKKTIDNLAIGVIDYLFDKDATFQLLCHFLISCDENSNSFKKFHDVQILFVNEFKSIMKRINLGDDEEYMSEAFFASLSGIVMMFRKYPGLEREERRDFMHKVALAAIKKQSERNFS